MKETKQLKEIEPPCAEQENNEFFISKFLGNSTAISNNHTTINLKKKLIV